MHTDGLGEVLVAVGVFGDEFAHQRQQFERVHVVRALQRLVNLGKLEHQKRAAGFDHAVHFFERGVFVGHVAQAESDGHEVEIVVGKRQLLRVGQRHGQNQAFVEQAVAADGEHGGVDVGKPHFALFAHALGPAARQIARAAGDVEHFVAFFQTRGVDGEVFPHAVQAAGHHVVHDVVVFGNGVKHFGHFAGFFVFVDGGETEVGFLLAHGCFSFCDRGFRRPSMPTAASAAAAVSAFLFWCGGVGGGRGARGAGGFKAGEVVAPHCIVSVCQFIQIVPVVEAAVVAV